MNLARKAGPGFQRTLGESGQVASNSSSKLLGSQRGFKGG